jgi:hypothetical protein
LTDTHTTEAGAIAALGASAAAASVISGADGRTWLIKPNSTTATEITDPHGMILTAPARVKQAVVVQTADSLVDYVDFFGQDETILFADIDASTIRGLIDYHGASEGAGGAASIPQHVDHRVVELAATVRLDVARQPGLTLTAGRLAAWRRDGASWEHDVVPVVTSLARKRGQAIASWKFFDAAVAQSIADNRQALKIPEARHAAQTDDRVSDRQSARSANRDRSDAGAEWASQVVAARGGF